MCRLRNCSFTVCFVAERTAATDSADYCMWYVWCVFWRAGFYAELSDDDDDEVRGTCDDGPCALRHSETSLCSVERDQRQLQQPPGRRPTTPDDWTATMSSCATASTDVLGQSRLLLLLMMMMMTSLSTQRCAVTLLVVTATWLQHLCRLICRLPVSFVYR